MTTDPYRVAYESALAEITEITAKFEELRVRKGKIENLIIVLQPMLAAEGGVPDAISASTVPSQAIPEASSSSLAGETGSAASEEPSNYSYLDVPNPLPEGNGDAFQRRVRSNFRFRGLAAQKSY
jgi:hypothetical protein